MNNFYNFIFLNNKIDPFNPKLSGVQHWIYYLFATLFIIIGIISMIFSYKYRNSKKEYEPIAHTKSFWKKIWYLNRFYFFVAITIISFFTAIAFFLINK